MGKSRKRKDNEYEKEIKVLNDFAEQSIIDGDGLRKDLDNISLCPHCLCMTHTIKSKCGKCKQKKAFGEIERDLMKRLGDYNGTK